MLCPPASACAADKSIQLDNSPAVTLPNSVRNQRYSRSNKTVQFRGCCDYNRQPLQTSMCLYDRMIVSNRIYSHMQQLGWIPGALCWATKVNNINLHTIYLCNIHKIEDNWRGREYVAGVQGSRHWDFIVHIWLKVLVLGDVCGSGLSMHFSGNGLQKNPMWKKVM